MNLGLQITGRREDGYHLLDSVFVPLDFGDDVRVSVVGIPAEADRAGGPEVTIEVRSDPAPDPDSEAGPASRAAGATASATAGVPVGPDNLAARAATRFLERAGIAAGVSVELTKRIPAGGGLGGGSSDAAAVLRALDRLFPGALAAPVLAELALGLGADVPFFLDPRPARVRGIGELIEPLSGLPALALVLANPGISLATSDVYGAWDESFAGLTPQSPRPTMPPAFGPGFDVSALSGWLWNDLEAPAVRLCPLVAGLQEQLSSLGAFAVGMSGSGATVFGVFAGRGEAEVAASSRVFSARPDGVWVRAVSTIASPEFA